MMQIDQMTVMTPAGRQLEPSLDEGVNAAVHYYLNSTGLATSLLVGPRAFDRNAHVLIAATEDYFGERKP
jgi:hypothetical protein